MLELWRLRPPFKNFQGETVVCYQNPGFVTDKQDECIVLIAPVQSSSIIGHPFLLRGLHLNVWELPFHGFQRICLDTRGHLHHLRREGRLQFTAQFRCPKEEKKTSCTRGISKLDTST